jgi:nitrite reductase/ring-hydroxylating ferredoxin subunit
MPWTKLATTAELPPGQLIEVEVGEDLYALCNVNGEIRVLHGTCPHQGGPLGEGALNGDLVTCPWHMWEFDSKTGACAMNPDLVIPKYPVKIEGADVLVDIA